MFWSKVCECVLIVNKMCSDGTSKIRAWKATIYLQLTKESCWTLITEQVIHQVHSCCRWRHQPRLRYAMISNRRNRDTYIFSIWLVYGTWSEKYRQVNIVQLTVRQWKQQGQWYFCSATALSFERITQWEQPGANHGEVRFLWSWSAASRLMISFSQGCWGQMWEQ